MASTLITPAAIRAEAVYADGQYTFRGKTAREWETILFEAFDADRQRDANEADRIMYELECMAEQD
jgi:hypothetical protein